MEAKMKGFPCHYCNSTNTFFIREQFDDKGNKLGELWRCNICRKNFRVSPEDKFKNHREAK